MSHRGSIDCFNANIFAVSFEPVVSHRPKTISAFAAEILTGKSDVEPSVSGEDHVARNSPFLKRGVVREHADLIVLTFSVLVSLYFLVPIVVIGEGPVDCWTIVDHINVYGVSWTVSPVGRGLTGCCGKQEGQSHKSYES